jgi:ribosomal protein L19
MKVAKIRAEIKALEKELDKEIAREQLLKNPPRFEIGDEIENMTVVDRSYKEGCTLFGGLSFFGLWRYSLLNRSTNIQKWYYDYKTINIKNT